MANYCTAEDVQVAIGSPTAYSITSKPTLTQVNVVIANITNELDLYLSMAGIASQPTDSRVLGRLKEACTIGSAARVGFGYINASQDADNTLPGLYWKRYQEILLEIKENPEIYGATTGTSTIYMSCPVLDGSTTAAELEKHYSGVNYKP
jgi:hypothetical protein